MEPSLDFVDNHATVFYREAEIEVENITIPVEIWLTENGQLKLETDRINPEGLTEGVYSEITGTTGRGEAIVINDVFCFTDSILSLNPQSVEICRNKDRIVKGEEVSLYADILGFQYNSTPKFSNPDDYLELLERTDWPAGSGNIADWTIGVRPLPDYTKRVNSIQNYHNLVRTVQLELSINGLYGGLDRIANVTDRLINDISGSVRMFRDHYRHTPYSRYMTGLVKAQNQSTFGSKECTAIQEDAARQVISSSE
jgi:hypothetical protein